MIHTHNDNNNNNDENDFLIQISCHLTPIHAASHPTGELEKGFEKEEMEMFSCQQITSEIEMPTYKIE